MGTNILDRIDDLIDAWLGLSHSYAGQEPRYGREETLQAWRSNPPDVSEAGAFLDSLLAQIESTWRRTQGTYTTLPSKKNWTLRQRKEWNDENDSLETILERKIARHTSNWSNQVPIASGLLGPYADKRRAVDLVQEHAPGEYTLYELKVNRNAGTPVYAAFEILAYGLVYVFSRKHREELGYDPAEKKLLTARAIHLGVLAPMTYYDGLNLRWLEEALNAGLAHLALAGDDRPLNLDFAFASFPKWFGWPGAEDELEQAIQGIMSVYQAA